MGATTSGARRRTYLCSEGFPGLAAWLRAAVRPATPVHARPILLVSDASAELPDRDAILAPLVDAARATHHDVCVLTAAELSGQGSPATAAAALARASALMLGGGDPFRLLAALRSAGLIEPVRAAHRSGLPVVGQSAGAWVCGPSLRPALLSSPFQPPRGTDQAFDLRALDLMRAVVLPHHDRANRAARHWRAAQQYGRDWPLQLLCDDEALILADDTWQIVTDAVALRPAAAADAPHLAAVFAAAAEAGWSAFLPASALASLLSSETQETAAWEARVADSTYRLLVAEDAAGIVGFARYGPIPAMPDGSSTGAPEGSPASAPMGAGEGAMLDLLYVHPRAWGRPGRGRSLARRMLLRVHFELAAAGYRRARLWTEYRNVRALGLYARAGWRADGSEETRSDLGVPIRNIGLVLDLSAPLS